MQRFVQGSKSLVIFFGATMAAACGTARTYAVPVAGAQMQGEYQPLLACASARNMEAHQVGEVVQVKVDELSWLEYGVDAQSNGYMSVRVDDSKVQGGDLEAKVASSKKIGDDLMSCASGSAPMASAAPTTPHAAGNAGPMNWSGNWMAKADYKWTCTVPMAKPEHGADKSDWSMTISGQPAQLSAQMNVSPSGFMAQGSGSDQSLRLCGAFPFKGKGGGTPNTRDNNVCVVVSEVMSANRVVGHAEGDFQTQFGIPCTLSDASIELTR